MQVGTGEGKSILLGGLSCVLALLGYDIYCASYSAHLSQRDYDAFKPLFVAFGLVKADSGDETAGIEDHIFYSTLGDLVETVINKEGDIRLLAEAAVLTGATNSAERKQLQHGDRPRILLIDEVDVFFSSDFYGKTYNPGITFKAPEIVTIMKAIWAANKGRSITIEAIQGMPEYTQLKTLFYSEAVPLLDQHLRQMIEDAPMYNEPPYELVLDHTNMDPAAASVVQAIGYKNQDSIDVRMSIGYRTAFAYLYEISRLTNAQAVKLEAALPNMLSLQMRCGEFSYAAIPQNNFKTIMGVTGSFEIYT